MDLILISTHPRMTWRLSDPPQVTQVKPESTFPSPVPHSLVLCPQVSSSSSPFSHLSLQVFRAMGWEKRQGLSHHRYLLLHNHSRLVPSSESAWLLGVLSLEPKSAAPLESNLVSSWKKATS